VPQQTPSRTLLLACLRAGGSVSDAPSAPPWMSEEVSALALPTPAARSLQNRCRQRVNSPRCPAQPTLTPCPVSPAPCSQQAPSWVSAAGGTLSNPSHPMWLKCRAGAVYLNRSAATAVRVVRNCFKTLCLDKLTTRLLSPLFRVCMNAIEMIISRI